MHEQTVIQVIQDRIIKRHNGQPFEDSNILCLSVEGGGMRGIISAGMVMALQDLEMLEIFDKYVGISAGSLNLSYILAGQSAQCMSVYFDDMLKKEHLSLLPTSWDDRVVMDTRLMYVNALHEKPLDTDALSKYKDSLYVSVSNASLGQGELVTLSTAGDRFFEYLMAGATIPIIAGDPWMINNSRYYDGILFYPDPIRPAEELNATHTFVLNTISKEKKYGPLNPIIKTAIKSLDKRYSNMGSKYIESFEETALLLKNIPFGETDINNMRVYRLAIDKSPGVGPLTTDRSKLLDAMRAGYQAVLDIFHPHSATSVIPTLMD